MKKAKYTTPNGDVKIDVSYQDENIWLTQKKMAELFDAKLGQLVNIYRIYLPVKN